MHRITLTLSERRIGIVGSNGSGKTTVAWLLNGLILLTEGDGIVDGMDTWQSADHSASTHLNLAVDPAK
ncbi:MAG: ATP-binding cassette domain-containing protein [Leptolyngbyaceae bacterium]|nr:ATP-binding cassette domain-containing protein [Leptolyngbyaceae bacterium]